MNPYPSYKNSGVEWIGEIPTDWLKTKLKFTLEEIVTGGTPDTSNDVYWSDEESGINWISISDITSNGRLILKTKKFISKEGLESKKIEILPMGSLIYSIYGSIGKVSRLGIPSTIHQGILGLKTNSKLNSIFLEYYLIYFKEYVSLFSSSNTQENLNQEKVSNFQIPFPSPQEQTQIVSFLDTKTQKIDELIEKTEQKIKLLKEGISSFLFYEKEGIDYFERDKYWFQIKPKSWEIVKFRDVFQDIVDKNHPQERLLSVHQKKGVIFRDEQEQSVMNPSGEISNYKLVQSGDFVISLRSSEGGFEYSEVKGLVSPVYTVLRPKFKIDSILFKYLFKSENFIEEINRYITGIREGKTINYKDIRDIPIPITFTPNEKIIRRHDRVLELFEVWKERNELLREYRQSLISEVVTGKIDVRDWNK